MNHRDTFIETKLPKFKTVLANLIKLKSISATNDGISETVTYLKKLLTNLLAADVDVIQTSGSPTIVATIAGSTAETVLFYGHYDAMVPGNEALWHTPPFHLTEKDGRLYGRGVGDNKGQLLGQIAGLYTYKRLHGTLPFNIKLLIEGEEEQGSLNLPITVQKLAATKLKDVDYVIVVDGSFNQSGTHVLRLGNRGALGFELTAYTGNQDNHSGNLGNIMKNPVLLLIQLINRLIDVDSGHVKIPHFYDGVEQPTARDLAWMEKLPYDPSDISKQTGVLKIPQKSINYYQRLMFEPTFNISGITSGYTGNGMKTIIPHAATVKIDCRLVAAQSIQKIQKSIIELLKPELDGHCVTFKPLVKVPASKTNPNDPRIPLIISAIKEATGDALVEPVMPGTVPNYVWTDILKVPAFTIPYANFDQHNHAPDENITLRAFIDGIKISYELINHLKK